MARSPKPSEKSVETLTHGEKRLNNPTAELASLFEQQAEMDGDLDRTMRVPRDRPLAAGETRLRDPDLDPQIVWNNAKVRLTQAQIKALMRGEAIDLAEAQLTWKGKDRQDWSDLVVNAPPLYIQEKVHPKAIIDDLKRRAKAKKQAKTDAPDLFADFNGLADPEAVTEFYQHSKHWQNRMILGDSLQVMASLAEREALRGKVQCIYFDPPYGIKFNSNWQVSTLSRDVKDGKATDISREPEQVKAFRDTWKDGIHSYLTYLRDRLAVARELLTESGSILVQIGDENVHRVRAILDEVFGDQNAVALIAFTKSSGSTREFLGGSFDYIILYAKNKQHLKLRSLFRLKEAGGIGASGYTYLQETSGARRSASPEEVTELPPGARLYTRDNLTSQSIGRDKGEGAASWFPVQLSGHTYRPSEKGRWKTNAQGMSRLLRANRLEAAGNTLRYVRFLDDFSARRAPPRPRSRQRPNSPRRLRASVPAARACGRVRTRSRMSWSPFHGQIGCVAMLGPSPC
ncbi:DNA methyltransferase [Chthonobacter rhizosphaerae]|uniref:DNA methyltransferase n=1 Tax=Chthonobacter rhizosphaerae TaxID=2735553 RepID=UPI001AED5DCD|nr:site-specific DNA-methyltransferase [Chthonobacter rhizosphaerae]